MRKCVRLNLCMFILLFTGLITRAQNLITEVRAKVIPMSLDISSLKTVNLIFPYGIKSVDRGNQDVLVQKAKGVENILQVKAAHDTLKETNLTVVTADGTLYSFIIRYSANPSQLNFSLGKVIAQKPWALFTAGENNDAKIHDLATQLTHKKAVIKNIKSYSNDIGLSCIGIYIKDDVMYLELNLENSSTIGYSVDQLRFYIQDQKKAKRTASQQVMLTPLYQAGNSTEIGANSEQTVIIALSKFTIPDQKVLVIEMMEKDGGRNLMIRVRNNHLVNVVQI